MGTVSSYLQLTPPQVDKGTHACIARDLQSYYLPDFIFKTTVGLFHALEKFKHAFYCFVLNLHIFKDFKHIYLYFQNMRIAKASRFPNKAVLEFDSDQTGVLFDKCQENVIIFKDMLNNGWKEITFNNYFALVDSDNARRVFVRFRPDPNPNMTYNS